MNKVYYKMPGEVLRDAPPGEIPVYIESVEVRTVGVVMADAEVVITYRPAGGTEVSPRSASEKDARLAYVLPPPADLRESEDPRDTFGGLADTEDARVESKHLRAAPETDGTWGPDDEAGLIRDMEDEIPMPGGPFGDGMK